FPNPGDRDVYRGIQEINKENYQEAQKCFEKGSNYDNEYASLFNALHYYTGFGFAKRDPSKALNLFKKIALEWNNPVAQYLIGTMYLKGDKGVPQNGKYAMKWLLLAAENNWADAMVLTGLGYLLGGLFKQDVLKSVSWFQKVVQKDDSETEPIDDGTLYLFGNKEFELHLNQVDNTFIKTTIDEEILPPVHYIDPSDSSITTDWGQRLYIIFWSILTNKKSRGIVPSQLLIGEMCSQTDGLAYEYGKNGVEDSIEALKWYKRTLELHGNIEAAYRIGVIFYNGKGIETDCKVALGYFKLRVRDSDHGPSYIFMGDIYEKGKDGVPNNYVLARQHFEKAFSCGEVRGAVALTRFYIEGLGVRKDMKKSEEWMMKAMTAKSTLEQTPPDFPNPGDRDVYRGIQEINKGNYQEAQKCFEKGSNYDNEYASLFNALHYYTGFGFAKRDPSKALNLFKKIALEWNNPVAQYLIGVTYAEGDQGVPQNRKYAIKWLSLAAENNWADAMTILGFCYLNGNLFKQDFQKAEEWFQKVAQKDDSETEPIDDGTLYLFGNKEFELCLEKQDIMIIKATIDQEAYSPGHYLDPLRNPVMFAQRNRLYKSIWSILTNKKSRGVVTSQGLIGSMNRLKDGPKSVYFFKKAAKNGSPLCCMLTASAYENGTNGVQDYKEALKWYKQALDVHLEMEAAYCIGLLYYNGKGVKRDCKAALEYFKLSVSENEHGCAYITMGYIFEEGKDGVPQDYILARQYFEKAFDCGRADAAFSLAEFYKEGLGVRKDDEKANEWTMKALSADQTVEITPPGLLRHI
ncbi:hypothetical protein INT48_009034, partial [Thamnidium elegans]